MYPCFSGAECRLTDNVNSYDKQHNIRKDFVEALKKEFPDYGLR
jgi:phosphomannomutase